MSKQLLGLDIGSQTIKAVQLSREKDSISLMAAGYIATPIVGVGASSSASQREEQVLAESIGRLVHDMKISSNLVGASLPSSKVVTRVIQVPLMTEGELASSIQWEAESYIPFPLSKVKLDYMVLDSNQNEKKMKVLLVAAPLSLVEKYMRIIAMAHLETVAIETDILAMSRSVALTFPNLTNIMVLSLGAVTTDISLMHEGLLVYTKSYPIGGNTLTRAIAEELGFETAQAEEYKKTYGLEEDKLEGKIAKILMPLFTTIFDELEKTIAYVKQQYPQQAVNSIVVCGAGAKLPGFVLSMTRQLGLDTQVSNPFINLTVDSSILPIINPDASLYTTAVGLALKEVA